MASQNIYVEPTALERDGHKNLRLKPLSDYGFAKHLYSSVIGGNEFFAASDDFPIVFVKGAKDKMVAMALLSLQTDGHTLGNDWKDVYVPAYVRRYPFVMDSGSSVLFFDKQCPALQEGEGEPLFNEQGEPSKLLNEILVFNKQLDDIYKSTSEYVAALEELDLLQDYPGAVRINEQKLNLSHFKTVNEKKFHEVVKGDILQTWFDKGWMAWTYAHLHSLSRMGKVLDRLKDVEKTAEVEV